MSGEKVHTPPPITGYRVLKQSEVDLMNAVKALGPMIEKVLEDVQQHLVVQSNGAPPLQRDVDDAGDPDAAFLGEFSEERARERLRINAAQPGRWVSISRTHFQEGLMALTRAVAQPESF